VALNTTTLAHRDAVWGGRQPSHLLPLNIRFHVSRRDQPNVVPESGNLTRPVVRRRAGLHPDQAGLQLREKAEHGRAPQLLLQDDGTIGVNAVKLKDGLGQIDPECCNLHVVGSFPSLAPNSTNLAHRDAVWVEPSTPSDR